jgi:uncharacterized protein (TIGR03067 family)
MKLNFCAGALAFVLWFMSVVGTRGATDEKGLEGTWKAVSAELGGRAMSQAEAEAITLRIQGTNYEVTVNGEGSDRGFTKIDPKVTPKAMDVSSTNGPNKGKTFPAIYELKGDSLRVCYNLGGANRPTEFKTVTNSFVFLASYKLKKE